MRYARTGHMIDLQTLRLFLVSTPLEVLEARLSSDTFETDISFGKDVVRVKFPPEWPGDALGIFPVTVQQIKTHPDTAQLSTTIIERTERVAVGQMGFEAPPDERGNEELGYGINFAYQNRGYATEVPQALVARALRHSSIARVAAECFEENGR